MDTNPTSHTTGEQGNIQDVPAAQERSAESACASQPTGYQQVTVDVPEDRLAEFHAFYARFLARAAGRGRRGRRGHRHPHAHGRGHGCGQHRRAGEGGESAEQTARTIVA